VPEALPPYLGHLGHHLHAAVFLVAAVDATGVPFPGRLLVVMAGAVTSGADAILVILAAAAGALAGDHVVYGLGRLGGERVAALYCRWTMARGGRVAKAREYVERFGVATILLGRLAFSLRLAVALLAGSGAMSYGRFLALDTLGALAWATLLVCLGRLLGPRALALLESYGGIEVVLVVGAAGMLALGVYRLWRRARERPAAAAG
jgi:membrane-associated protein